MKRITLAAFILLVTAWSVAGDDQVKNRDAGPAEAQSGKVKWQAIGPGVLGSCFALAISPVNPDIMLSGTDMAVLFRTADGGKSWKMLGGSGGGQVAPGRGGSWGAAFDAKRPEVAWALTNFGVFKSLDTGVTWKLMTAGLKGNWFWCIAIDPTDPDIVYVGQGAMGAGTRGLIWKTADGGTSWRELPRPGGPVDKDPHPDRGYQRIAIDPNSPFEKGKGHQRVFLAGEGGLFVSEDAGGTWGSLLQEAAPKDVFAKGVVTDLAVVDKGGKTILFATVPLRRPEAEKDTWVGGIYRSDDLGKTWAAKNNGLEKACSIGVKWGNTALLAWSPAAPDRLWSGWPYYEVARSDDLGESWRWVSNTGEDWVLKKVDEEKLAEDDLLRDEGGDYYCLLSKDTNYIKRCCGNGALNNIVASKTDPNRVAFATGGTVNLTRDGGTTWDDVLFDFGEPFDEGRFGDRPPMTCTHKVRSRGAQVIMPSRSGEVALDPFAPKTIAIPYMDNGLQISHDGGEWWEARQNGIASRRRRGNCDFILFDPAVKGRLYGAFGTSNGLVYESEDGARSFRQIGIQPLLAEARRQSKEKGKRVSFAVWQLAVDPRSPAGKRTLYAATQFGVYKSVDGGVTWEDSSLGLGEAPDVSMIELDPQRPDTLYVSVNGKQKFGLFRTRDAGMNWTALAPDKLGTVRDLSICAGHPDTFYATAAGPGRGCSYYGGANKLWRSDDGGETWRLVMSKPDVSGISAMAVNPFNPDYLYYASQSQRLEKQSTDIGVWRSHDGGKTWEDIGSDIPVVVPHAFTIDAKDPTRFFMCDYFCVWEGHDPLAAPIK